MSSSPITQGLGIKGRFAGLSDEFSDPIRSKIAILPVAFDKTTTYRHGAEKGPAALIEASRNMELYDIETKTEVYLKGISTLSTLHPKTSEEMLQSVYQQVCEWIQQNKFVVTIGGEHSISYASIKAFTTVYPSLGVLQLDAHADLQHEYEGNRWSHACVMARVLELPAVSDIVSVGIRSLSREELKNLERTTVFFWP